MDRFKKIVDAMTAEYVKKNGHVASEFATGDKHWGEKVLYLNSTRGLLTPMSSRWTGFSCENCAEQHGPEYNIHLEIVSISQACVNSSSLLLDTWDA